MKPKLQPPKRVSIDQITIFGHTYKTLLGAMRKMRWEEEQVTNYKRVLTTELTPLQRETIERLLPEQIARVAEAKKVIGLIPIKNHINILDDFKGFM